MEEIYNEDKVTIATNCDLAKGHIVDDTKVVHYDAVEGQKEKGHYEVLREYPNGGKDVKWIIDTPRIIAKEAQDKEIPIKVYKLYTKSELDDIELLNAKKEAIEAKTKLENELKVYEKNLSDTDYKAIKYAEGWITEEEYSTIKAERQSYRDKVNEIRLKLYPEEENK